MAFDEFMNRVVVATVQSGAGRTLPDDSRSDLYPIELSRESIRPGTIFVDPYGHLLVISQWVDRTDDSPGMLFAIDGHPDLSIGRKRFWRGAFLFVDDLSWGAGGFKAFRPVFIRRRGGPRGHPAAPQRGDRRPTEAYGNYSDEQYQLGTDGFYERMERVINPDPLDPAEAQRATLDAFYELVQERIDSVCRRRGLHGSGVASTPSTCPKARRSSRPPAPGRTTPRLLATCGYSSPWTSSRGSPIACRDVPRCLSHARGSGAKRRGEPASQ